ncbi:MAG: methionine--tRNA ligase [Anaerolineales bacterium]|nr:methionine--tRNA ligase [Anaerolineales bacterium]
MKNVLVAVAWPYANADIHVGNITGSYLPADVFARYHRLKGNRVLMVSGTDSHGTPITVRADSEKSTPEKVYQRYHRRFIDLFQKTGLTYDLFTSTHTENHFRVAQDFFRALKANEYLFRKKQSVMYSEKAKRFLPDRYVEGECYLCHYPNARGDQCDQCGNLLDATQLINPRSRTDGSTPVVRETEHFFLDLEGLSSEIRKYLASGKDHWRPNVLRFARNMIEEGLHGRPITRDLDWGIPLPEEGWEGKRLYVWFEAVIGYFSASVEWAHSRGEPEAWKDWWYKPDALTYYFIGKDNIPFHAVIWPAQLIGTRRLYAEEREGVLNLPTDVPANEFMNLEGRKISGSRNWAVWGLDAVERYGPDPVRYYLTVNMPETRDTDWDWADFLRRNNDELVATWGNLANRVLTFSYRNWEGCIPSPGELRAEDNELLAKAERTFGAVGGLYESVQLRAALAEAMALAGEANRYLDQQAPWFQIKTERAAAAKTIFTALRVIDSLKTLLAPVIPFSSEELHTGFGHSGRLFGTQKVEEHSDSLGTRPVLTYDPAGATGRWEPSRLAAGQPLAEPKPLFRKLLPEIVDQERARLGKPSA